jgi:hypothetical protein
VIEGAFGIPAASNRVHGVPDSTLGPTAAVTINSGGSFIIFGIILTNRTIAPIAVTFNDIDGNEIAHVNVPNGTTEVFYTPFKISNGFTINDATDSGNITATIFASQEGR